MKPSTEQILTTVLLILSVTIVQIYGCQVLAKKSSQGILQRRLQDHTWMKKLITYLHYPTLYYFSVCTNASLEIGQPLVLNSSRTNLKYIVFQNSTIHTVPVGVFSSFSNVTELYLNNSGIEYIHPGAFSGMVKLEELYLQSNRIQIIERGTINYLLKLKILDISNNCVKTIQENSFLGLFMLTTLYLNVNELTNTDAKLFSSLKKLQILDLSNNSLSFIHQGSFSELHQFEVLILRNNKFTKFVLPLFHNTSSLVYVDASLNNIEYIDFDNVPESLLFLNLSSNKLVDVKNWFRLQKVSKVDMSHNLIESANKIGGTVKYLFLNDNKLVHFNSTFEGMSMLELLDLSHNAILSIPNGLFNDLSKLYKLSLNSNKIKILPPGCFNSVKRLKYLDLSRNLINAVGFGTFNGLANLQTLSLANNQITDLQENSFHLVSSLKYLDISGNFIKVLVMEDLMEHLKLLETISLGGNHWDCNHLFKALKVLKQISVRILADNNFEEGPNVYGVKCDDEDVVVNNSFAKENIFINKTIVYDRFFKNYSYPKNMGLRGFQPKMLTQTYNVLDNITLQNKDLYQTIENFFVRIICVLTAILTMFLVLVVLFVFRFNKIGYFKRQAQQNVNNGLELR